MLAGTSRLSFAWRALEITVGMPGGTTEGVTRAVPLPLRVRAFSGLLAGAGSPARSVLPTCFQPRQFISSAPFCLPNGLPPPRDRLAACPPLPALQLWLFPRPTPLRGAEPGTECRRRAAGEAALSVQRPLAEVALSSPVLQGPLHPALHAAAGRAHQPPGPGCVRVAGRGAEDVRHGPGLRVGRGCGCGGTGAGRGWSKRLP